MEGALEEVVNVAMPPWFLFLLARARGVGIDPVDVVTQLRGSITPELEAAALSWISRSLTTP
jgi:hypothetical protein